MLDHMVKGDSTGSLDVVVDRHRQWEWEKIQTLTYIHPSIHPYIRPLYIDFTFTCKLHETNFSMLAVSYLLEAINLL